MLSCTSLPRISMPRYCEFCLFACSANSYNAVGEEVHLPCNRRRRIQSTKAVNSKISKTADLDSEHLNCVDKNLSASYLFTGKSENIRYLGEMELYRKITYLVFENNP